MITFPFSDAWPSSTRWVTRCRLCEVGDDTRDGLWEIHRIRFPDGGVQDWDLCPSCARDPGLAAAVEQARRARSGAP